MKPQRNEKAKDEAYRIFLRFYGDVTYGTSKQCAKIAVKEIISAIDWHEFETPNKQLEFWNGVLKEIYNL